MGMFDYIDYRGPLPKTKTGQSRLRMAMNGHRSQSKSLRLWETDKWGSIAYENGCVTATVDRAGILFDPEGQPMDWTGYLRFYGSSPTHKAWEFVASVERGMVTEIFSDPA